MKKSEKLSENENFSRSPPRLFKNAPHFSHSVKTTLSSSIKSHIFNLGKTQVFVDQDWKDLSHAESFKLTKIEGQVRWFLI